MANLICKIHSDKETRRFNVTVDSVTYTSIHKLAKEILNIETPFCLQYKDDEGDIITMSTDDEMAEAVRLALSFSPAVLRLTVQAAALVPSAAKVTTPTDAPPLIAGTSGESDRMHLLKNIEAHLPSVINNLPHALKNMEAHLPSVIDTLPPGLRDMVSPHFAALIAEQAKLEKIPPQFGADAARAAEAARHVGVACDKSGMSPIMGDRYHLIGSNYDLCEAEFNKLSSTDQAKFEKIPVPVVAAPRCGGRGFAPRCGVPHHKPAARFVSDVAVFDGTQVTQSMPFTKIWRLKNVGDCPWPYGTNITFVGGDSMSADQSAPLISRTVNPGEEVDVAIDMVAPGEVGRYIGYWRLVGPYGRRFGQKVWCHVQVVDPTMAHEDDFLKAQEEVATMMAKVIDDDEDDAQCAPKVPAPEPEAPLPAAVAATSSMTVDPSMTVDTEKQSGKDVSAEPAAKQEPAAPVEIKATESDAGSSSSDDGSAVLVDALVDEDPKSSIVVELLSMGFTDGRKGSPFR